MPRILARGVVFDHGTGRPFPTPFDLDLGPGWTGLVGPNGAGKTTLLRLFAGELRPSAGELRVFGGPAWLLRQLVEAHAPEAAILQEFADDWSSAAGQLRSRLRLDEAPLGRWPTLSPGERKRWQIGAALARTPQLLLCDEPSNHLDADSRALLLDALARYRGLGVIVSHDRALLDALCSTIVFLDGWGDGGRIEQRPGNYSAAAAARELEREAARGELSRVQAQVQDRTRQLADAKRKRASTARSRRSSSRKRDHRDHDASSMARKSRADRAAARAEAGVRRAHAARARAEAELAALDVVHERRGALFVDWIAPRKATLVSLDAEALAAHAPHPGTRLPTRLPTRGPAVVSRDARVHLRGPSGAGKSSLLAAIFAHAKAHGLGDRSLWLPQELDADARQALLARMHGLDREARGRMLQLVANAGLDPGQLFATRDPSPGEARKLALALGLSQRSCCLLLLDEPTNHLDLPTIEALERMLASYPGALILVCHDHAFARALTNQSWIL